jgi:hypothetical protein
VSTGARGQTIADVIAKIPALESRFGTYRDAIRVYPTPDDPANRCELRVLDHDPHARRGPMAQAVGHRPFVRTKTADEILETLAAYCERIADSEHRPPGYIEICG